MAKFAPVCPPQILSKLARDYELGDYHLLLAHDIVARPDDYEAIFGDFDEGATIILDNSIIELGDAVSLDVIASAAATVCANVIVLPDVLLDGPATIMNCDNAIPYWTEKFDDVLGQGTYSFMIVPQGKTIEEFEACARYFADMYADTIGWWGIPRNAVKYFGTRAEVTRFCWLLRPDWQIHLLGFSDNHQDDVACAQLAGVSGIDSAVPVRAADTNVRISDRAGIDALPPRGDWWDRAEYTDLVKQNVINIREMINGQQPTSFE